MASRQYWLMKTEPGAFSYQDLERDGWTHWDGVRNHQAKKNLAAMQASDLALIYHSVSDKEMVGIARITKEAYPDPTDETGKWLAVRVEPVQPMVQRVSLQQIKETPELADIPLIRQARLSVMPLSEEAFNRILDLGKTKRAVSTK